MPLLNLEKDDAESLPVPTSKANWIVAIICTLLTLYIVQPWRNIFVSPMSALGSLAGVVIVLTIPIAASILTVRYTRFKNIWGLVFVVGWIIGQLILMALGIVLVYFLFLRTTGFEIAIEGAPPRSEVWIDGARWTVTESDGTLLATGLKSNELKKIEIRSPNFTCEPREIEGKDGEIKTIKARCTQTGK